MKSVMNWWGRVCLIAAMGLSTPVWAQDTAKAEADKLYEQGVAQADREQWLAAAALFEKSYALDPSMNTIAQWGRALVLGGNHLEGAKKLEQFLRESKQVDKGVVQVLEGLRQEATKKLATLHVTVDPKDAVVSVDGTRIEPERAEWPVYVKPGEHTFTAQKNGFVMDPVVRTYAAGQDVPVPLTMVPEQGQGQEGVESGLPETNGNGVVGVVPKKTKAPAMTLPVKIGFGVAGGLLVGSGIMALVARDYESRAIDRAKGTECKPETDCEQQYEVNYSTFQSTGRASVGLLGAAAVMGIASWGYYLFGPKPSPVETKMQGKVSFVVVPHLDGLTVVGSW